MRYQLINAMQLNSSFIYHVKNMAFMKQESNNEGMMDLVFDWYALSLSNHIYSWRKDYTGMVSTFVHSAQKVR